MAEFERSETPFTESLDGHDGTIRGQINVAAAAYAVGDIVSGKIGVLASATTGESRTAVAAETRTLTAEGPLTVVLAGEVQASGLNGLTDLKRNELSQAGIIVEG